jgi:hypothetical protein
MMTMILAAGVTAYLFLPELSPGLLGPSDKSLWENKLGPQEERSYLYYIPYTCTRILGPTRTYSHLGMWVPWTIFSRKIRP